MAIFLQVLTYLVAGVFFGGFHVKLIDQSKNNLLITKRIIEQTLIVNTLSLAILRFGLNKPFVLLTKQYETLFVFKYLIFASVIGMLVLTINMTLKGKLIFTQNQWTGKMKIFKYVLQIISILLFTIGLFLWIGTKWFIEFFGELTPEQFLFNLHSPVTGTASNVMDSVINTPVLKFTGILILFCTLLLVTFKVMYKDKVIATDAYLKIIMSLLALFMLVKGAHYSITRLHLDQVKQAYFEDSAYIKDNYVDPKNVNLQFPEKKRNLVHIYLESYENSFYDKKNGGYLDQNVMPELMKLTQEGVHFSESDTFGGPHQTYGSSWSVASMVNQSAGLPLKIPMGGNDYGKSGYFLPGATTIGDILNKEGYNQTIMFGADADFGGLTSFFTNHKDFKIFDVKYARQEGLIPQDYNVWWGYEDKKLYQYAKDEMTRLSKEGKPFNLTMENADTHFPNGYIEKDTPRPFDSQYMNVFAHSQKEVVKLVRWIQAQPFYQDTTIVLTGDHLSMDKTFFEDWDPNYHRTTTNVILNGYFENDAQKIKMMQRQFAPFDYYPTILSSMGVKIPGHRLGLGTDLSSNEKTLIEKDGLQQVNDELSRNSKFYNQKFVDESQFKKNE